jgi:hypothetical protein
MNFSAILDISSFFIGMIINLLLIALICYYFKRKYENLEIAQNEQAKVLYQLLQQNTQPKVININDLLKKDLEPKNYERPEPESDSDEDTDTDGDGDSDGLDDLNELDMNVKTETVIDRVDVNEIKTIKLIVDEPIDEPIEEVNVNLKLDLDIEVDAALDVDIEKDEKEKEKDYSKMTIKQLKDVLSTKGININNNKMKKNEMIELIEKSSITINE